MEDKITKCEEHNTYHIGICPICEKEEREEIYREQTFVASLIIIGILCIIALTLLIFVNL